jgi:kinesin family member 13
MSVKVAVRVRPFNGREKELGSDLCIGMHDKTTTLLGIVQNILFKIDLEDPKKNRDFTFDYSFWSHDAFENDENGYTYGTCNKYAAQRLVFDTVGKEILKNAWDGYHCCLFAYG